MWTKLFHMRAKMNIANTATTNRLTFMTYSKNEMPNV
jgi:hypothetical protein